MLLHLVENKYIFFMYKSLLKLILFHDYTKQHFVIINIFVFFNKYPIVQHNT